MRSIVRGAFALATLLGIAASVCIAQGLAPPQSSNRDGLNFSVSSCLHRATAKGSSDPGYIWSMGMGYGFTSQFSLELRILYGDMRIPANVEHSVLNATPLAGGGLEARFLLAPRSTWSPFLAVGYDIATVVNAQSLGYSGNGPRGTAGCEYGLSRFFGATAEVSYWNLRFGRLYDQKATGTVFEPFINDVVSVGLSIRFYPDSSEPQAEIRPKD